jgi:hypothetical protein
MNACKLFILIFVCSVVSLTKTFAQEYPDYVITTKGDSIPCNINKPFFGSIRYQGASMTKAQKIEPDAVKEYFRSKNNDLQRVVYKEDDTDPLFMKVIEKGKISLYQLIITRTTTTSTATTGYGSTTTTNSTKTWYIAKGTDSVKEFKTSALFASKSRKERKDDFGEMLKDNKAVYNKYIAEDKFSFKQIQNLVHLYNTGQPL